MAIFKAGEKISKIFKNGQEISTIYKDGQLIYRNALPIYGIRRNIASSDVTWERIEANKGKTAEAYLPTNTTPTNDFDKIYPWSDIITCNVDPVKNEITAVIGDDNFDWTGANGEVMTYFPEFWIKRDQVIETDGTYEYIYISANEQDGYVHIEPFMVGRYTISGAANNVHSKSGQSPLLNTTITNYRAYAKKIGNDWGILDWHYFVLQYLYLVEYANNNSQNMLGRGIVSATAVSKSGGCDNLNMKSGSLTNDGKNSVIYRGIEDIYGNIYNFIDGLNTTNYKSHICYDPSKYAINVFSGDYVALSYTNSNKSGYVQELGFDKANPLVSLPISARGSASTYYPDNYSLSSGNKETHVGGYYPSGDSAGLWGWNFDDPTELHADRGGRLLHYNLKITEVTVETASKTATGDTIATIKPNGIGPYTYEITNKSANFDEYIELQDNKLVLKKDIPEETLTFSANISAKNRAGKMSYSYSQELNGLVVDFATGTDAQIGAMLEAHYRGDISISDYWHVGDTRKIHIDETNSGSKAHVAQDMTMVIMDFNHDDLTTSINGISKAAVSVGFRETMGNNGTSEDEYYWGSLHYPVKDNENYSASLLRTWLNGGLLNALPSTFSSIIKEVNKKNLAYHTKTDGAPLITKDKIWLLSYPEIFETQSYSYYKGNPTVEGEQYQYFATSSNRIKYSNKNGEKGSANYYWLRSPSSDYNSSRGYPWCVVSSDGSADANFGNYTIGLAPAFCL